MKKSFWALLASLTLAATMAAAVACTQTPDPDPDPDNPIVTPSDRYTITLGGGSSRTLDVGEEYDLTWTVTKNGEAVTDEPVTVTVSDGDILRWDEESGTLTALARGSATVTVTLADHTDVSASVTFTVQDYFFSREIGRGSVNFNNEANGSVSIAGGSESSVIVKDAGTQFVFRATITMPEGAQGDSAHSVNIGSFVNAGDNALWFGIKNDDNQADGVFGVYIQDYYEGWPGSQRAVTGYGAADLGTSIEFEIIRDGSNYYYSIGGYYGTYTSDYEEPTYPGIYSQTVAVTVSDFTVTYDAAEVAEAAAAYADKGAATIVIQADSTRLVRGGTYPFTATVYPTSVPADAVEWSIDKSGMTAGADATSVSPSGMLTLAADAAGSLVLTATSGSVSQSLTITILEEAEGAENDQLIVSGGVLLNADGSVTFPEDLMGTDGVGNESGYQETAYCAVLKDNVSSDFSVTFTVSDYTTNSNTPKLQLALGGANNFYIVYSANGTCRVEAYTGVLYEDGHCNMGYWANSEAITAGTHTFTVSVDEQGRYTVSMDGTPLAFTTNENAEVTLIRDFSSFRTEQPVKFATKNCAATVSDIQVTDGTMTEFGTFWKYNANATINGDDGFTSSYVSTGGWTLRNNYINSVIYTHPVGDFALEFDLEFSEATTDTKFIISLGNWEFHINNKLLDTGYIAGETWYQDSSEHYNGENIGASRTLNAHVRLERSGDAARFIINDMVIADFASGVSTSSLLRFWIFNNEADYNSYFVTVSNFTVGGYSRADIEGDAWTYNDNGNVTNVLEDGFTLRANDGGWGNEEQSLNKITSAETFEGNAALSFDLAFSGNMSDGKFVIMLGGTRVMINNKLSANGGLSVTINGGANTSWEEANAGVEGLVMNVRIVRAGTSLSVYINDVFKMSGTADDTDTLSFFVYNGAAEDADITATLSHLEIEDADTQTWIINDVSNVTNVSDTGFTLRAANNSWSNEYYNAITIADAVEGDVEITFDLAFSAAMSDAKFIIQLGGQRVMINNKTAGITANIINWDESVLEGVTFAGMSLRIVRTGGEISLYVGDAQTPICTNTGTVSNTALTFWFFNQNGDQADVTATVSNLYVSTMAGVIDPNWSYTNNGNQTNVTENGFTLRADDDGWNNGDKNVNKITSRQSVTGDVTIEFTLSFSAAMTDAKFIIELGGQRVMINNINGMIAANIINYDRDKEEIPGSEYTNLKVRIVRSGETISLYINDSAEPVRSASGSISNTTLAFFLFNVTAEDADATATVTGLTVTSGSVSTQTNE